MPERTRAGIGDLRTFLQESPLVICGPTIVDLRTFFRIGYGELGYYKPFFARSSMSYKAYYKAYLLQTKRGAG